MRLLSISLLCFPIFLAGCSEVGGAAAAATIRDSAGVTIVENTGPAWPDGLGWRVAEEPEFEIGGELDDPAYDLNQVRAALRLSDGRVVVADGETRELRFYDETGEHLATSGRQGGGPGEFQRIGFVWLGAADTLWVYDFPSRRLSTLDADGAYVDGIVLRSPGQLQFVVPAGRLSDGTLVAPVFVFDTTAKSGIYRQPRPLLAYQADGTVSDTLGTFPGPETYTTQLTFNNQTSPRPAQRPFALTTQVEIFRNQIFVGTNEAFEIQVYDETGSLTRLIRTVHPREAVEPEDIAEFKRYRHELMLDNSGNIPEQIREQFEQQLEDAPYPDAFPYYTGIRTDTEGNLWVQGGKMRHQRDVYHYTVFDTTGQELGQVTMPEQFTPMQLGADWVIGVWRDEDDLEYVRLYQLIKE
ncbi:MAG: hypothetical protein HKM89_13110 [Gemmatimonadales bacterium]|nr:hypothetical protein [Gemmatimonadales bacterium]